MRKKSQALAKNPLSIGLGIYLSQERLKIEPSNKSTDVAELLDMGDSLYRMIESGNARIHPKYLPAFINVFMGSKIQVDAFCKLLIAIQYLDSYLSSKEEFKNALKRLIETDIKYKPLMEMIIQSINILEKSDRDVRDYLISIGVIDEINLFLSTYENYGKTPKQIQNNTILKVIEKVPTIYYDFIANIIQNFKFLPMGFKKNDLWDWEEANNEKIKKLYALIYETDKIISEHNLSTYKYDYIWEKSFGEAHLIFVSDKSPKELTNKFSKLLRSVLEADKVLMKKEGKPFNKNLSNFDNVFKKIIVHSVEDKSSIQKILKLNDDYKIAWVFELSSGINVGLRALNTGLDYSGFTSLGLEETEILLDELKKLIQ